MNIVLSRFRCRIAAVFCALPGMGALFGAACLAVPLALASTGAQGAPTLEQTQAYLIEKTASGWKKKRDGLSITQTVTFPSKCEMRINHRYESLKRPGTILVDEVALVPIAELYKLVAAGDGISVRAKGKVIVRQNTYFPDERKHKKICGATDQPCDGKPWNKDSAYLDVVAPHDLYREKVGKAIVRLMELCGAGSKELF